MIAAMQRLISVRPSLLLVAGVQAENRKAWHLGSQGQLQTSDRRTPAPLCPLRTAVLDATSHTAQAALVCLVHAVTAGARLPGCLA